MECLLQVVEMTSRIKNELKIAFDDCLWLDNATRSFAHKKLSHMKEFIGYPTEIKNKNRLMLPYAKVCLVGMS